MSGNELEVLEHYNKKMKKYEEHPDVLLRCLTKLDQVRVNISLLQDTGIGRTVSALKKKYGDSEVGAISRDLVSKWKGVVAREEEVEEETQEIEAEDNNTDDNSNPPIYTPTPIIPAYNPTPIQDLPVKTENINEYVKLETDQPKIKVETEYFENVKEEKKSNPAETSRHKHKKSRHVKKEDIAEVKIKDEGRELQSNRSKDRSERESRHRTKDHHSNTNSLSNSSSNDRKHSKRQGEKHKSKDRSSKYESCESTSTSSSNRHHKHKELKIQESDRDSKLKSRELASFDMFSRTKEEGSGKDRKGKRPRKEEGEVPSSNEKRFKSSSLTKSVADAMPPPPVPALSNPLVAGPSQIPDISPIYKPLPRLPLHNYLDARTEEKNGPSDEESISLLLSQKNKNRTAIYSGTKRKGFFGSVPSLFDQCIQVLKDNIDAIDEVGNLGYDVLGPVLKMASPETLMHIEDCNHYLMEDTGELWEKFVGKNFPKKEREDMESWREMFERCQQERSDKLDKLKGKVKQLYKQEKTQHRETKLAYVDIAPKAPSSVRRAQAKHGTALPSSQPLVVGGPRPRNYIADPTANASRAGLASKKPRTAPLMAKTFKLMKGIKGGFRR